MKAWKGRFSKTTDLFVESFTSSLAIDRRLYREDIEGSQAHARMLASVGLINEDELNSILEGLYEIRKEMDEDTFVFSDADEDIHMAIEAALTRRIGDAARKLHTGRSRNDQVALDERLYLRKMIPAQGTLILDLLRALHVLATENTDLVIPGLTHLQFAQPVSLSHFFMAYFEKFRRDFEQFKWLSARMDEMPLGAGALAGSSLPLNPDFVRRNLGFSALSRNSLDAVSDRDPILRYCAAASICANHLSSLAEEWILWNSPAWNCIELPDEYATGSSMMPQKKNPDIFELIRGRAGKIHGALIGMLVTTKALPLSYNRDLQEDKEPLFDTADTLAGCLQMMTRVLPRIRFNTERFNVLVQMGYMAATDCAEALVEKGVPFRKAHEIIGQWVARAVSTGKKLGDFSADELKDISLEITPEIILRADPVRSIETKKTPGSPGRVFVQNALAEAAEFLSRAGNEPAGS